MIKDFDAYCQCFIKEKPHKEQSVTIVDIPRRPRQTFQRRTVINITNNPGGLVAGPSWRQQAMKPNSSLCEGAVITRMAA